MGRIVEIPIGQRDLAVREGRPIPDFRIFTAGIEPYPGSDRVVRMTGSSTEKDMQGDTMSLSALSDMAKSPANLTIWLNHDYSLPDSIFGSLMDTPSIIHSKGVADLELKVDVEMDNPAAARVKRYIDNGRRLGCSVGCMVTKYEVPEKSDGEDYYLQPIIIHGVYVVEFSVVGIPANQRSWVENAIRGVFQRTLDPGLVPAMKSLWTRAYKDIVDAVPGKTDDFAQIPARPAPSSRMDWSPAEKTFVFSARNKQKSLAREEVHQMLVSPVAPSVPDTEKTVEPEEEEQYITNFGVEDGELFERTACGSTSLPLNMERSWDKGSAHGRLLEWAGGKDHFIPGKFKKVHFRYTGAGDKITDFHFPFADIIDGSPTAIWHAVTAAAAALGGARGGANDEGDEGAMRSKIAHYYHKAGKTPPWQDGDGEKGMDEEVIIAEPELDKVKSGSKGSGVSQGDQDNDADDGNPSREHPDANGDDDENGAIHPVHKAHVEAMHYHIHQATGGMCCDGDEEADEVPKKSEDSGKKGKSAPDSDAGRMLAQAGLDSMHLPHIKAMSYHLHKMCSGFLNNEQAADQRLPGSDDRKSADDVALALKSKIGMPKPNDSDVVHLRAIHYHAHMMSGGSCCKSAKSIEGVTEKKMPPLNQNHIMHLSAVHYHSHSMSGGQCCPVQQPGASEQNLQDARSDAAMAAGQDVSGQTAPKEYSPEIIKALGTFSEALSKADLPALQKDITAARSDIAAILEQAQETSERVKVTMAEAQKAVDTVAALKNMPLGSPVRQSRSIDPQSEASHSDFLSVNKQGGDSNLEGILSLTREETVPLGSNSSVTYRVWPEGVGKGVRPELTGNQIMLMAWGDIQAYRKDLEARVPKIDDPGDQLRSRYSLL